ncbi:telomeric repeat binding factor a [Cyprinodon tularosa]|uniref:telomeric repeat binding factor a n=1 Tax=Cyprinodon tularosa TaxID=77115 RepID=UPI0018E24637|nr:telomeric repeat binding factor a [Cyprinodon tularosa]
MEGANMAENERVNINNLELQKIVNRWIVDYYFSVAVEFFKNHQYADFCGVRTILDNVLERPTESVDDMLLKLRVLQFLSRINEGDKLNALFDPDQSKTSLESALDLLENMRTTFQIPHRDIDSASTIIKEMIVGTYIKNELFNKAQEALALYLPKPGNQKRDIFSRLIRQQRSTHKIIDQLNFPQFKTEMLQFCQQICRFTVPYLHKAAKMLLLQRIKVQHDETAGVDEQEEPSPSSCLQTNTVRLTSRKYQIIQKASLEIAYKALAEGLEEKTFSELEEEVEAEAQEGVCLCQQRSLDPKRGDDQSLDQEAGLQRDSCGPMEASPAEQPPQRDAEQQDQTGSLYTVARLVVEPDSQVSTQYSIAAEELERRAEKPPQTPPTNNSSQGPLTEKQVEIPTRIPRQTNGTQTRTLRSFAECSSDSEDDSLHTSIHKDPAGQLHDQSNKSSSRNSNRSSVSSEHEEEQQEKLNTSRSPMKRADEQPSRGSPSCEVDSIESLPDSPLDISPNTSSHQVPQKNSTPHKGANRKLKLLMKNAEGSKVEWKDEESFFPSLGNSGSNSGKRKREWTEKETEMLREGVKRFGEGNWSRIKAHFPFKKRTNVNLKDRWRTMKKKNLV